MATATNTKSTFHRPEAENNILAACLHHPEAVVLTRRYLDEQDFYLQSHRHIWRVINELANRNMGVDPITVVGRLDELDLLDACGGANRVASMNLPSWANIDAYAKQVLEASHIRRIYQATAMAQGQLETHEALPKVVSGLADTLRSIREPEEISPAKAMIAHMEAMERGEESGVSLQHTMPWFHALAGAIQDGSYYVLGALSGHGKTSMMSAIVAAAHKADPTVRCLWFACEMPVKYQMMRIVSAYETVREEYLHDPRKIPPDKRDEVWAKAIKATEHEAWLDIRRRSNLDARQIAMEIEAEAALHPDSKILCVVDYIQRCEAGEQSARENVAKASQLLAAAALDSNATVFALSQFTESGPRNTEVIELPTAQQLRTSKDIEHDAVQVLIYHRPYKDTAAVLALVKNRYPMRKPGIVHLEGDERGPWFRAKRGSCSGVGTYLPTVIIEDRYEDYHPKDAPRDAARQGDTEPQ